MRGQEYTSGMICGRRRGGGFKWVWVLRNLKAWGKSPGDVVSKRRHESSIGALHPIALCVALRRHVNDPISRPPFSSRQEPHTAHAPAAIGHPRGP
eukprot:scaffold1483_cov379-Prasinococcus_capsulatus_cf.AAC.9